MLQKSPYIAALCNEIKLRSNYLDNESIQTIYFGGGTPSQLSKNDLSAILNTIRDQFTISDNAEITLEANPDDLNGDYITALLDLGFNRLSMGVQSFNDEQLKFLNRRHSAQRAIDAVQLSQKAGFQNINIDLMYGLPKQTLVQWKDSLNKAIDLNIQHISSYHLIYEEGTKLYKLLQKGDVRSLDEELSISMFSTMIEYLDNAGFIHYEISNFGKENYLSNHNSSYWLGDKYLGLGPSAHSFDQKNRCWNISSIPKYIKGIETSKPEIEVEYLDEAKRYNDFILTGMRTMWGINIKDLEDRFGQKMLVYCETNLKKYIESGDVLLDKGCYKLNRKGIFISDSIMSDLMYID